MGRNIIMLAVCIVVAGFLAAIWFWFARRLARIEEARWGKPKAAPAAAPAPAPEPKKK